MGLSEPDLCPCCGRPVEGRVPSWRQELNDLVAKYSYLGISPDLASLSLLEAWGLYRWLSRLGGQQWP